MIIKDRKKKILEVVIKDYINNAEPVGSRTISKRYDLGISPATIRNEMADLEEMGFLMQPHTSSGRIPTSKAYRYYVDEIMQVQKLAATIRRDIHEGYLNFAGELDNTMTHTANMLSNLTQYTSIVLSPRVSRVNCKHIQVIPLIRDRILIILVTIEGIAKNIEMNLSREINNTEALKLSNVLNSLLKNIAFQEMNPDLIEDIQELTAEETGLLKEIISVLRDELLSEATKVHAGGVTNLFNYPEFSDVGRVRNLLDVIEKKPLLAGVMKSSRDSSGSLNVMIGEENGNDSLKEFSIVTTTYEVGGETIGTFGIIGPTRMDYEKVSSILQAIRDELNENISKLLT